MTGRSIRIEQPREDEGVGRFVQVPGSGAVTRNCHLWVFVYTKEGLHWPRGTPAIFPNHWHLADVMLGEATGEFARYAICAVVADDTAHTAIEALLNQPGDTMGISELPQGADIVDLVVVTRVK